MTCGTYLPAMALRQAPARCRMTMLRSSGNQAFATSSRRLGYADTVHNLLIGKHTRVIFQGFTGRQATANAAESLAWGTQIVGGTKPNFTGSHQQLDLPVLPTVRKAMTVLQPHATGIYVPASLAASAIEEAVEAEVPLIVAVAEHIPIHDIMRIHSMLATQSKSRMVGANSPGIISATGNCRIGFQPLASYMPGPVAVAAKSGTLSYETVTSLTEAGVGQSLCIGIGGDVISGTDFVDALRVFEKDDNTKAIVLIGEIGGTTEIEAADWIKEYRRRVTNPKPIAALIGGVCAVPGKVMGHAGAWTAPGEPSAKEKWTALENAGVTMVDHPGKFGRVMKSLLSSQPTTQSQTTSQAPSSRRQYHTLRQTRLKQSSSSRIARQHRSLYLRADQAKSVLRDYNISLTPSTTKDGHSVTLTVARTQRSPCIIVAPNGDHSKALTLPFPYKEGPSSELIGPAAAHLGLASDSELSALILALWKLFLDKEGITLSVTLSSDGGEVSNPDFTFDDAAFNSGGRHSDFHKLRDLSLIDPAEVDGEQFGLVYLPVALGNDPCIGTLVNGAGLAMNTMDSLVASGLGVTNFLDTGGKATSKTVKESLRIILTDRRVKVVFVNIFGGLTKCDMIGEGVLDAMEELQPEVPVVVRLRGTREKEAEAVMARAKEGMKVYCEPDFEKSVDLLKLLKDGQGPTVEEWLSRSKAETQ